MAELLTALVSWPSLLLVLLVFGFAPGFCLRLIVLAYPCDHPRRTELIAELYAVPHIQRPLWVAEQLEVALFEGLAHRKSAAPRRRLMLGPVAVAAAVLVIGFAGVSLSAQSAHPGDNLFPLTKVLYNTYARSVEAAMVVETELDTAQAALEMGDTSQARQSLERIQGHLAVIAEEQGYDRLVTEHRELEEMLR